MCPAPRGPPHQTQLADPDATYLARAHNCDFVAGNKIAVLNLGKEEAMLTTGLFALALGEEGGESIQPLAATP